ncbi:transposase, partial [Enterococcus faecium]|uniref:transposase n=5 Tax=Enterococcus faecium TaxID=1352 RepID=UPI001376051B
YLSRLIIQTALLKNLPETLDAQLRTKLQNLLTYEEGIYNAMIYPYSNGKIEAKIPHIKTLKRLSYGFKSFENMKIRIFCKRPIEQYLYV